MLNLDGNKQLLVDLPETIVLQHGDALVCEDGSLIEVIAADEALYQITASDSTHLARLSWHIGNRHLPAQIEQHRILIARDHVIHEMLTGLGAIVADITAPFSPERGAYHNHASKAHSHHHG